MTPTLPEILAGQAAAISAPQPPEAAGDYMASRLGTVAMLAILAAQEAERGPAARLWENAAIRMVLSDARDHYDDVLDGALSRGLSEAPTDFSWSGLDAENAVMRRLLIRLHEAVEGRADAAWDARILRLYRDMAHARRLDLPSALA